jgi:amino acid adenylation domain-containing protein
MSRDEVGDPAGRMSGGLLSVAEGGDHAVDHDGPVGKPFRAFPLDWIERAPFALFAETAAAHPDKTAIDDGESFLTYREAHEQAVDLARHIAGAVPPGRPVGIALPNGSTYPVAMLAALAAGRAYVPLDLSFPETRNSRILKHAGVAAVIVDRQTREVVSRMGAELPQLDFDALARDGGNGAPLPPTSPDDAAFIIYTSGSTGQPKGAYFNQRSLMHDAMRRINATHLAPDDRLALLFAPTVRPAQEDIYGTLFTGGTLFVVDLRRKGLQEFVRVLKRGRITLCFSVPYVFRRIIDLCEDKSVFQTVRNYCLASDRVFSSDVELFRRHFPATSRLSIGVGSTETNWYAIWFMAPDAPLEDQLVPVGYAPPHYTVSLLDEEGRPVPRGEPGEFVITSRFVAQGYWNDEVLTKRVFSVSEKDPKARNFRIGDLGRMRADGLIELIGRRDRQLKIRGNRVEPAEIEATIREHPAVRDAAVIPRIDERHIELAAYIVVKEEASLSSADLALWLADRLPGPMRPKDIYLLAEIPMLGNFKHDIIALTEMDKQRRAEVAAADAPRAAAAFAEDNALREAVAAAWKRRLDPATYDQDIAWENAGGDSAAGMELIFELERQLGRPVAMEVLGPRTRPSDLIAALAASAAPSAGPLTTPAAPASAATAARPLVLYFPGLFGAVLNDMRFAQLLSDEFDVRVLEYPPVEPTRLAPIDFDALVAGLVVQIRAIAGDAPLRILGYSMGGMAAYEAARILSEDGADIAFLGIIDFSPAYLEHSFWHTLGTEPTALKLMRLARVGRLYRFSLQRLVERLVERQLHRRQYRLLAWEWRLLEALGLRQVCLNFRVAAVQYLRANTTKDYRAKPYAGRMHLFRAEENPDWKQYGLSDDLRWGELCPEVTVHTLTGGHVDIYRPPHVETTLRVVSEALRLSEGPAAAGRAAPQSRRRA